MTTPHYAPRADVRHDPYPNSTWRKLCNSTIRAYRTAPESWRHAGPIVEPVVGRLAVHEAAHAVVSLLMGVPFEDVRVNLTTGGGRIHHGDDPSFSDAPAYCRKRALVSFAGPLSELLMKDAGKPREGCESDYETAHLLCMISGLDVEAVRDEAWRLLTRPETRDAVLRVASYLLLQRRATEAQVRSLIKQEDTINKTTNANVKTKSQGVKGTQG